MKFICGCDPSDPHVRNYHPHLIMVNGQHQLTNKMFNRQGIEICPIHSLPLAIDNIKKIGPQGDEITDYHAEFLARYGGRLPERRGSLGTDGIKDRRDNSDPATIGAAVLAERAAISNGQGEANAA